ncbi:MAG TPA: hypothetical protein VKX28_33865 [Xanthobacteraceae bacterium]|nr:hypothetical protein [Xanthobacteraceae bacterium]
MKLVQIFLPLRDNRGRRFEPELYSRVRADLMERFGGLTAYARSPAHGPWISGRKTKTDDIVIFEVMTPRIARSWWKTYRRKLERLFRQDEIVVRVQSVALL